MLKLTSRPALLRSAATPETELAALLPGQDRNHDGRTGDLGRT
jgi:hypothetical protein